MCGCIRESKPSGVKSDAVLEDESERENRCDENARQNFWWANYTGVWGTNVKGCNDRALRQGERQSPKPTVS
jgi:hypothetical protein